MGNVKRLDNRTPFHVVLSSHLTADPESPVTPPLGPPLIGALLRAPVDAIRSRMLAGLHAAGFTDLGPAHFAVLRYPGPENRRPADCAVDAAWVA